MPASWYNPDTGEGENWSEVIGRTPEGYRNDHTPTGKYNQLNEGWDGQVVSGGRMRLPPPGSERYPGEHYGRNPFMGMPPWMGGRGMGGGMFGGMPPWMIPWMMKFGMGQGMGEGQMGGGGQGIKRKSYPGWEGYDPNSIMRSYPGGGGFREGGGWKGQINGGSNPYEQ